MTNTSSNKLRRRMAREPKSAVEVQQGAGAASIGRKERPLLASPKGPNKTEKLLSLLGGSQGATLDDLMETTGWFPHTTRASLTGLRKKGYVVDRAKEGGTSRDKLVEAASR
jgi:hypothetical protein